MTRGEHLLREVKGGRSGLKTLPHTFALFVLTMAACAPAGDLGGGAPLGYARAEVVELIERAAGTADPEARDRVYRRLAEILQADVPITFLGPRVNVVFAHRRLQGLRSPWRVDPVWYMEELWLEDGK